MTKNIMTETLQINGMTCVSCENRIERKLKNINGIFKVNVRYSTGKAVVTFDANTIQLSEIIKIIEQLDYKVVRAGQNGYPKTNISKIIGISVVILSLYMILSRFGLLNVFNIFPEAEAGMGYGMLFVIGVLTSFHCIAMCGGINLSQCIPKRSVEYANESKLSNLKSSFLYNLGRVTSYTIIGGIVGALGKVISFSGPAKGIVQLAAGVFMVIMGLNMLNVFPWLRRLNPRMPKIFARKVNSEKKKNNSPLYIGLLNGLMPCGPLQAMQLYALSTGSFITGALSMLLFSLGTVPLMFGLGALSSILSKKFTSKMMTVGAVLVVILGVSMFGNGMSLSGLALSGTQAGEGKNQPQIKDNVQIITTKLSSGRYEPITVQVGIPVRWTIEAEEGTVNGCNNKLIIPEFNNLEKKLEIGDNIIEFTPTRVGTFSYSCWMGMIRSNITVVDNIKGTARNGTENTSGVLQPEEDSFGNLKAANDDNGAAGGCCSGSNTTGAFSNGKIPAEDIQVAKVVDGIQTATVTVDSYGYSPAVIVLEKGKKFILKFNPEEINGCDQYLYFPEYDRELDLKKETKSPVLTAKKDFTFACSMNMLHGYVKVVDDINKIDIVKIRKEVQKFTASTSGGGCCG